MYFSTSAHPNFASGCLKHQFFLGSTLKVATYSSNEYGPVPSPAINPSGVVPAGILAANPVKGKAFQPVCVWMKRGWRFRRGSNTTTLAPNKRRFYFISLRYRFKRNPILVETAVLARLQKYKSISHSTHLPAREILFSFTVSFWVFSILTTEESSMFAGNLLYRYWRSR